MILIVEDMAEINEMLCHYLEKDGYTCVQAFSGSEATLLLEKQEFDLILLDLMLPGISGEEVLKSIKQHADIPVIVISAKDKMETRVEVLELGADDYICKPFDLQEVLARVHVQLRKAKKEHIETKVIQVKDMALHLSSYQVNIGNAVIPLTKHEFRILRLLMESPNQVFTKQVIYEYAWEEEYYGDERIINTHIGNLRAKFRMYSNEEYIQTVWGIGFKFAQEKNL